MALISANTGMGSGLAAARSMRALPPEYEPVNPMAFISGAVTTVLPTVRPPP